jgi:DNA-binding transcriptional LysR family regulator
MVEEPRAEVRLKEMEMSAVIGEVSAQQSDLGIIFLSDLTEHFILRILQEKHLTFTPLVSLRPHVFMRKEHPLAGQQTVTMEQLRRYPYVAFTQTDSNLNYAEEVVVGTAADFDQVVYVSDRATIYSVIAHTNCVSTGSGVLPEGFGHEQVIAVPLQSQQEMRLGYITLQGVPLSDKGQEFVEILRKIMAEIEE